MKRTLRAFNKRWVLGRRDGLLELEKDEGGHVECVEKHEFGELLSER